MESKLGELAPGALAVALKDAEKRKPSYTRFASSNGSWPLRWTDPGGDRLRRPAGARRKFVDELATLRFIEEKGNVLLIGTPGVGKTMLAVALGRHAVEAGYRVYYATAANLVANAQRAALEGRWQTTRRFWNGPQLLIIDGLGYLLLPAEAASHLFQVFEQ